MMNKPTPADRRQVLAGVAALAGGALIGSAADLQNPAAADPSSRTGDVKIPKVLRTPLLCVFGADDHVTGGDHRALSDHIPGAAGQPHTAIPGAAHFIQEDKPAEFAAAVNDFIDRTTR